MKSSYTFILPTKAELVSPNPKIFPAFYAHPEDLRAHKGALSPSRLSSIINIRILMYLPIKNTIYLLHQRLRLRAIKHELLFLFRVDEARLYPRRPDPIPVPL